MSARPLHAASGDAPPLPQRLGKYLVSHLLGEGAMGVVYKAIDPDIHRPVAIKAIRAPLLAPDAQDISATTRFRTEAQAAGRLSHPNIVSVYEYGEMADQHYIAMEYVDGTSLQELVSRGDRLPLDDALSVMLQLLDALACAHEQGVWHRDIKPANLLLTPEGRLKVTDFGIARIDSADRTHRTTVLGSPGYMAPERYTDEAPDRRVDLFSSGVLMYELLTGRAPFRGAAGTVMYQVLNIEPVAPSTLALEPAVPPQFDAVVARAMAKRADERYADAAQMRAALCAAAERPIAAAVSAETMRRLRFGRIEATQVMPRVLAVMPRDSAPPAAQAAIVGVPSGPLVPASPSLPEWDARALAAIESLLLPQLGPMTRLVVRDGARRSHDMPGLLAWLAAEVVEPEERAAFLARARAICPSAQAATKPSPSGPLPVLGTTPMQADLVEKAQRVLAEQIGPIAAVLARRAATTTSTREAFFSALADAADAADGGVDRKQLLVQLWRIH